MESVLFLSPVPYRLTVDITWNFELSWKFTLGEPVSRGGVGCVIPAPKAFSLCVVYFSPIELLQTKLSGGKDPYEQRMELFQTYILRRGNYAPVDQRLTS